jgi:hypothetical protein
MNSNPSLPKADLEAWHASGPNALTTAQKPTGSSIHPAEGAAQQIAQELEQSIPGNVFLSVSSVLAQNYLPQPSFINLLREILPAQHNPIRVLERARTVDELINCHAGLVKTFGINQSSKADLFGTNHIDQTSVPAHLIKNLVRITLANQNLPAPITDQQSQRVRAFANYLANFTQSYPKPRTVVEQLNPHEALTFLNCLSGPHAAQPSNWSTSNLRQKLALHCIDEDPDNIELLPRDLSNDRHFIEQAILIHPGPTLAFASEQLQSDPNIAKLVAYRQGINTLETPADPDDNNNPLMVIAAACHDESELHYISEELRNNRDFILAVIAHEPFVLSLVDPALKNNPEFMMTAVSQHGWALEYASESIGNNRDVVLTAVKKHGNALQFANDTFTSNHEIVLVAVKQDGGALRFASDSLKDNKEIVLAAVTENPLALAFASDLLRNDFQIVHRAVKQDGSALRFASFRLVDNDYVVNTAINNDPLALEYASYRMKNNYDLVLSAVSRNGQALQFATPRLQHNQQLLRIASMNAPR